MLARCAADPFLSCAAGAAARAAPAGGRLLSAAHFLDKRAHERARPRARLDAPAWRRFAWRPLAWWLCPRGAPRTLPRAASACGHAGRFAIISAWRSRPESLSPSCAESTRRRAAPAPRRRAQIKVKTLTGKEIEIDIESDDTISRIKERVEEKEGIPPPQQRLIFGGKQMSDEKKASEYNIEGCA